MKNFIQSRDELARLLCGRALVKVGSDYIDPADIIRVYRDASSRWVFRLSDGSEHVHDPYLSGSAGDLLIAALPLVERIGAQLPLPPANALAWADGSNLYTALLSDIPGRVTLDTGSGIGQVAYREEDGFIYYCKSDPSHTNAGYFSLFAVRPDGTALTKVVELPAPVSFAFDKGAVAIRSDKVLCAVENDLYLYDLTAGTLSTKATFDTAASGRGLIWYDDNKCIKGYNSGASKHYTDLNAGSYTQQGPASYGDLLPDGRLAVMTYQGNLRIYSGYPSPYDIELKSGIGNRAGVSVDARSGLIYFADGVNVSKIAQDGTGEALVATLPAVPYGFKVLYRST